MLSAIQKELHLRREEINETVETIYFGGGTPSVLSSDDLSDLIKAVYENYKVSNEVEITLEANPDDLLSDTRDESNINIFEAYKNIGINRLSIGVQSFFDTDLKLMNRAHDGVEAIRCLYEATQHFENISIDLIYGIQDAPNDRWIQNIETALSFNIPHISSYALTVEPNTALASYIEKGIISDTDDEQAQEQFLILKKKLEKRDYIHYELSNFGKESFFSKNNSAYWQGKPYLGIGPSAHSYNGKERAWNVRNNTKYIKTLEQNNLPIERETLTKTDHYNEYIMTGLRTMWGVSLEKIEAEFGNIFKSYLIQQAKPYIKDRLLFLEDNHLKTSKKGLFLSDGIASDLFMLNLEKVKN